MKNEHKSRHSLDCGLRENPTDSGDKSYSTNS